MNIRRQAGSVLITVIMALTVVAAVAFMLNQQGGAMATQLNILEDRNRARYLAEAGLSHAFFAARTAATSSMPYPAAVSGTLNGFTYHATLAADPKYPGAITVVSTGQGQRATYTFSRPYSVGCAKQEQPLTVIQYPADRVPAMMFQAGTALLNQGFLNPSSAPGEHRRVLLAFDLSAIPAGAQIRTATLMLDVRRHDAALEGGYLIVNRLTKAYSAQQMTWTKATSTVAWNVPGGDYSVGDITTPVNASTSIYQFNVLPIVSEWLKQPPEFHYGLILRADKQASASNKVEFQLETNSGKVDKSKWPRLVVTYCS